MSDQKTLSIILLVPFLLLTAYAMSQVGYVGLFEYQLGSSAGWQVLADLVIALILVLTWLIPHAKENGRNPWLWVALTLTTGSIGPLLYFATSKKSN